MKEANWQECIENNSAIEITPNNSKVDSLKDTSNGRIEFLKDIIIIEDNANYVFENYYSSMLELFHCLMLIKGFKVLNHLCIGHYIKDQLNNEKIFRLFDDARYKKNSLIYYGKKMDFEIAKEAINKCKELISITKKLIEKV